MKQRLAAAEAAAQARQTALDEAGQRERASATELARLAAAAADAQAAAQAAARGQAASEQQLRQVRPSPTSPPYLRRFCLSLSNPYL